MFEIGISLQIVDTTEKIDRFYFGSRLCALKIWLETKWNEREWPQRALKKPDLILVI